MLKRIGCIAACLAGITAFAGEIRILGITNAASFRQTETHGGMLVTIFCTGLEDVGDALATGFPLPETLNGIEVTQNGTRFPLLAFVKHQGYQQINAQVPWAGPPPNGMATSLIRVSHGESFGTTNVRQGDTPIAGEIFRDSQEQGLFFRADWSQITEANPARPNELVIAFSTGFGGAGPTPPGLPNPVPAIPVSTSPSKNAGWNLADPVAAESAWRAPGLAGVEQIHFRVPMVIPASGRISIGLQWVSCIVIFPGLPPSCTRYGSTSVPLFVRP